MTDEDLRWMKRALEQAQQSVGLSSPNPAVGCVLVANDGSVAGEGFHEYEKFDHAEIVALKQAGNNSRGATAYVTLEPCSHFGRTGPCADALIAAGVGRVVVATGDPNPTVNGKGIAKIRAAGIEVEIGALQNEARVLNDGFAKSIRTGLPFVTLKAGTSLDGCIAPASGTAEIGKPHYITGEASRAVVQQMRHASDALITGIGTVLADNPQLTDRSGLPRRRLLLRVVLDSSLRLPLDSNLVQTVKDDVLVFCTDAPVERQRDLEARGVRVERVADSGEIPLARVLERLGEARILNVMLEGGSRLNSAALNGQFVDKLCLFYAPQVIGNEGVRLFTDGVRIQREMERISWTAVGKDVRFEAYLRDPWT